QMDRGADGPGRVLLLAGAERDVPERVHMSGTSGYRIALHPVDHTIVCGLDDTILTAILRSRASVMFGCRGGGCGTCKMRLISGRVDHGRCSVAVLSEEEKEHGWFLSCQARPLSELTIELTPADKYRAVMSWGELK